MQLDPIGDGDWPEALSHLRGGFMGQANIYRVMAHHPDLVKGWTGLREHLVARNALGPERSEVVILRLAHRLDATDEWAQHVVRARSRGLEDARIRALEGPLEEMDADDALIARAVDALVDEARVPLGILEPLGRRLGPQGLLDLLALVGLYMTIAFILKTFGTPLDADVAAELERRPLS